ncbi:MAG: spore coat protein [Velocimicrobium sp.]
MTLTQKETTLLQDLKAQEKLCVDKYNKYSASACDGELKTLFSRIGKTEQKHLDTVTQIMGGSIPSTSMNSSGQSWATGTTLGKNASNSKEDATSSFENDKFLCEDTLASEKFVSSSYNTMIFEFKDSAVRDALNHNQKEEQQHGEQIYNYMESHGMYNAQQ